MLKSRLPIVTVALLVFNSAAAECVLPEEITVPDGLVSSYEEMRDGQTFVKAYMAEMEAYLDCLEQQKAELDKEAQPTDPGSRLLADEEHLEQRTAAIDAMEAVAAQFNEQVRAFKIANP